MADPSSFLNGKVTLYPGDCMDVLPMMAENSVDAVCCDPPYHLTSIVKRFGKEGSAPAKSNGATGVYQRSSKGFMSKVWDGGDIAFRPETWAEVLRVMKPGAHLLAFGGTRTYHRLACAIEDGGFDVRDAILWHYGSGFPKSHDISKALDRMAGAERTEVAGIKPGHEEFVGRATRGHLQTERHNEGWQRPWKDRPDADRYHYQFAAATDEARQWSGWGTALKPATEIIVLARKPLSESSIAANVLRWNCGALNIDACRVPTDESTVREIGSAFGSLHEGREKRGGAAGTYGSAAGRWPANIITDGSEGVVGAFPETGASTASANRNGKDVGDVFSLKRADGLIRGHDDSGGSAARFFYTAKADAEDRLGSKHPTVKPLDLIRYLVRLITPPNGVILDPFAGTGTLGQAAVYEGFRAILIEREAEYVADIERRMALTLAGPEERQREIVKARGQIEADPGPLFAGGSS